MCTSRVVHTQQSGSGTASADGPSKRNPAHLSLTLQTSTIYYTRNYKTNNKNKELTQNRCFGKARPGTGEISVYRQKKRALIRKL